MQNKIIIPPIKSQGIKSKLVPWIKQILPRTKGKWIEPFMGTGVVGFNLANNTALMGDSNPYIIDFYSKINLKKIKPDDIKQFLYSEGKKLSNIGEDYYYEVRNRFNLHKDPLDFLFINRSCFNGMIRFNKKGNINVPFCHKNKRFSKSYITKIINQVNNIIYKFENSNFIFTCQDFITTIAQAKKDDIIYCDPPYIDRYADYYNGWDTENENKLFNALKNTEAKFILSTWHHNIHRENTYILKYWNNFNIITKNHYYHLGGKEENRNIMVEALVTNFDTNHTKSNTYHKANKTQLNLFA